VTTELACPWWAGWKDVIVPRPYPREFRDDVVRVARNREDGVTIEQIATDFGVHPVDPHRIRSNYDHTGQSGRVTETVTNSCSRPICCIGGSYD
jgi:transposase